MKRSMGIVLICLTLAAGRAGAEDGSASAADWGKRVERIAAFDHTGLDEFNNPEHRRIIELDKASVGAVSQVLWAPDGKSIIYTSGMTGIFAVSPEGGEPRLLFDSTLMYPFKDRFVFLNPSVITLNRITADGHYLYFSRCIVDTTRGTIVNITEHNSGDGNSISATVANPAHVLERLDLQTGECEEIMDNVVASALSPSGRYMSYRKPLTRENRDTNPRLMDLSTGEITELPGFGVFFTPDERYVVCSKIIDNQSTRLLRVPVGGGEPEQILSYPGVGSDFGTSGQSFAPDGERALMSKYDGVYRLGALNIRTGEISNLTPFSEAVSSRPGAFSPDCAEFCYIRQDTAGSEIFIRDFSPADSDTPLEASETAPENFAISGNYPNPFNPSTTIGFSVLTPGMAKLTVYDVTGRKVRELVSGYIHAGKHAAVWDGRNDAGMPVASGTYIARLRMGSAVSANRMLLVK